MKVIGSLAMVQNPTSTALLGLPINRKFSIGLKYLEISPSLVLSPSLHRLDLGLIIIIIEVADCALQSCRV